MDMFSIVAGTILLAIIRSILPNHWLPLVAIAKMEKWKLSDLMMIAAISASAHVIGTILLGVSLGYLGTQLAQQYENSVHTIVPALLICIGLLYFCLPFFKVRNKDNMPYQDSEKSKTRWVLLFSVMMLLSPCLEVQSLFIAAGSLGKDNIFLLAQIYAIVSLTGIMFLTHFAFKGATFLNNNFIRNNANRIAGTIIILVGILTFFVH